MATIQIQHTWQNVNGLSKDRYVNTWYGTSVLQPAPSELADIAGELHLFYTTGPTSPAGDAIVSHMPSHAVNGGFQIKMFNMDDPKPRAAIYDEILPYTGGSPGVAHPSEVAMCLSYETTPGGGIPQARKRGRVYLGPFVNNTGTGLPNRPDAEFRSSVVRRAQKLAASWHLIDGFTWSIYSPTLDQAFPVVRAWMDDAWDTQRRRGDAPTSEVSQAIDGTLVP